MVDKSKPVYQSLTQLEQILKRPDMYIGNLDIETREELIGELVDNKFTLNKKKIDYSDGFMRLFIEIISNAIDNTWRSSDTDTPCTKIKVNVNQETGEIIVWNDGLTIPIEIDDKNKKYNPELIFGQLNSGSNYDDNEQRLTSGLNGLGSKLTNMFSTEFKIDTIDNYTHKRYQQIWTNQMREVSKPKISKNGKKGYTQISYKYENSVFKMDRISDDLLSLMMKYTIEMGMLTKVNVFFNDKKIPVKNLHDYIKLNKDTSEHVYIKTEESEVIILPSDGYESISYVNGINTPDGGIHVDSWSEKLLRPIFEKYKKQIAMKDLKQRVSIYVNCLLPNPKFVGQTKNKLSGPKPVVVVEEKHIKAILRWKSLKESLEELLKSKELVDLKTTEKKNKSFKKIKGYDPANFAGKAKSEDCILILSEGLSAKTFAVKGLKEGFNGKKGRDYMGILALKGKCFSENTEVVMWDGTYKKVQDIIIGDELINENGNKTIVKQLFSGDDEMYEIQQDKGNNYIVNSQHTLTLKFPMNGNIYWQENKNRWMLKYYDFEEMIIKQKTIQCKTTEFINHNKIYECYKCKKIFSGRSNQIRHYKKFHPDIIIPKTEYSIYNKSQLSKEEGHKQILDMYEKLVKNDYIDISIEDYLKLNNETKRYLKGIKLETDVNWCYKPTELDPYVLGTWLGDGSSNGYGFSSYYETDKEVIDYLNEWGKNNDAIFKKINTLNKAAYTISSIHNFRKMGHSPLKKQLEVYNLINNKHIPREYIINDKDTRLMVLAGIIDTDGHVGKDGRIEISQCIKHKQLIDDIVLLSRSLGIFTSVVKKVKKYTWQDEKREKECYCIMLSGNNIKDILTKIPRKKITHTFTQDCMTTKINVVKKEVGKYYGFETDDTHRFLLKDFTIVHNCINTRNASVKQIANNTEITNMIQILNLKHGKDYTIQSNYNELNYGKIMLLCDSDVDGHHISGLIINFIHNMFPSLLKRGDFLLGMMTPIVNITLGNTLHRFYTQKEAEEFIKENDGRRMNVKYLKGLGSSTDSDIKKTFGKRMVNYLEDKDSSKTINKVFNNKQADDRKKWMEDYNIENTLQLDLKQTFIPLDISDFLNLEMIKFSIDDCLRSIPNVYDGLKQSQRKILYAVTMKGSQKLKVSQLSGFVSEKTNYHHGEDCLNGTIIKMAQNFVGSNNINLLEPEGQLGSRVALGKDAASPRYIFTYKSKVVDILFPPQDSPLLDYVNDDGDIVEPEYYVPIIPMILCNGITAIGTGWSSNIPSYNPKDLKEACLIWLENSDRFEKFCCDMKPYYKGFNGKIEKIDTHKYTVEGKYEKMDKVNWYRVTEIPINMSIDVYKEHLEDLIEVKKLKSMKNYSDDENINFEIHVAPDFKPTSEKLKLKTFIHTSNMVCFTDGNKLKRFDSVKEIIETFCKKRLMLCKTRKVEQLKQMNYDLMINKNKYRFIKEVVEDKLKVFRIDESVVNNNLKKGKYNLIDDKYDYLLNINIRKFNKQEIEKLNSVIEKITSDIKCLEKETPTSLWKWDLRNI